MSLICTPSARCPGFRIAALVLVAAAAGCAYYNTFYLAKRYFKEGQKAQERSVSDAPAAEAIIKFDAVIRQCNKVINEYPDSKWVDDAMYLLGASMYGKGDYGSAVRRMADLRARFPNSPFIPEARLIEGLASLKRKDYAAADSIFASLDAAYPKFPRKWELYYHAAESKALQRKAPEAVALYERAIAVAKERREKSDALRRAGDALVAAGRRDSAQAVYLKTLGEEERPKIRLDVALRRAEALRDLKRYAEALEFLNEWRSTAIAERREGEFYLRVHEVTALLGRNDEAIQGYRDIVERFPNTHPAHEAQFQIGYLYETAGDLDQAAREYEKLRAVGAGSEFASQAQRRSQNLAALKQYRQSLASDTTSSGARSAFRLAELYYFEMGKRDSAVAQYREVERRFPSSAFAPKSAYARLWIRAHDENDTLGAMALTDTIAARYRGTRYAESALYLWKRWSGRTDARTALFDSLLASPDTSAAWRFADDPDAPPEPPAASAVSGASHPDSGFTLSPEKRAQLIEASERVRAAHKAARGGAPTPPDSARVRPPATADTTRTGRQAPPDSLEDRPSAAPPDTSGTTVTPTR